NAESWGRSAFLGAISSFGGVKNRGWKAAPTWVSRGGALCGRDLFEAKSYAQQLVEARLAARLLVHLLHDHRAVEAVLAVGRRQVAAHHRRARRHAAVEDLARLAVVDARALADVHAHGDDRAAAHHDAFDDLRARADEAVVLDDRGRGLER